MAYTFLIKILFEVSIPLKLFVFNRLLGPVSRTPRYVSRPGKYFFELIYLSADSNYWRKLSNMFHEIIKIKI